MTWGDKKARVNLRLPVETRRALERLAGEAKLTLSEYLRAVLVEHAAKGKRGK